MPFLPIGKHFHLKLTASTGENLLGRLFRSLVFELLCVHITVLRLDWDDIGTFLAAGKGVFPVGIFFRAAEWRAGNPAALDCQSDGLASANSAATEAKRWDVRVPLGSRQMKLLVSFEETAVR